MPQFKKYKLGDIVVLNYGKSLTAHTRIPGKIPVYSSSGITGSHNKALVESPAVIVGRKGTVGSVFYTNKSFYCIDTAYYILPSKEYDLKFLYYMLQTIGLEDLNEDSAVPGLNRETAYSQDVDIPDLPSQTRIASILSSLDDKIELNRRTNQTMEQIAQTLFKKYFVDDIDPENLPEGWRWGKLGDVTIRITKGTTPTTLKKQFVLSGINFLKVENLTETGTFDKSKLNFIDEETDQLLSRSRIQDKDILFSIAGTLGRIALVNESILPANTNQALAIIRPDLEIIEPLYIFYWLKQSNVREEIFSKSVQGVQANLSLGVLSDIDIIVPSKDVLVKKFESINPIYKKIEQNENEVASLVKIRDSLLPKLMSGEIEVNVTEKELVN